MGDLAAWWWEGVHHALYVKLAKCFWVFLGILAPKRRGDRTGVPSSERIAPDRPDGVRDPPRARPRRHLHSFPAQKKSHNSVMNE